MRTYDVRITEEDGKYIAWIDIDGNPSIRQEARPGSLPDVFFTDEADATAWANEHVQQIQAAEQAYTEEQAKQAALVAQAQADSERLARIEEKLDQLLGN